MVARQYAKLQKHFDIIKPPKIMQDVEIEHDFNGAKKKFTKMAYLYSSLSSAKIAWELTLYNRYNISK